MHSLRARLFGLWLMLVASGLVVVLVLLDSFEQTAQARVGRAEELLTRTCADLVERLRFATTGWQGSEPDDRLSEDLHAATAVTLARAPGVEGGAWLADTGPLAYAFPTYEGTGPKTDLPSAERPTIEQVNADASRSGRPASARQEGRSQTLLVHACPLPERPRWTAWTMTRVGTAEGPAFKQLLVGIGAVAATLAGSAIWLAWLLVSWSGRLARLEAALARRDRDAARMPSLPRTGTPELDRLVDALNATGEDLARERSRASASERLAAIGQLSAGLAHEIRNPIGAMRLKAENALATGDVLRQTAALRTIVGQIDRVDHLLDQLLRVTPGRRPTLAPVDLAAFIDGVIAQHRDTASARSLRLTMDVPAPSGPPPRFDLERMQLALGNLVANAVQNTPPGGTIAVAAIAADDRLVLRVTDDGPGVPAELHETLFAPFVTGRPEGTGLGLAIVDEVARAHGGAARRIDVPRGAAFEIEVPWPR